MEPHSGPCFVRDRCASGPKKEEKEEEEKKGERENEEEKGRTYEGK